MVRKELKLQRSIRTLGLANELALLSEEMQKAFVVANAAYAALGIRYALAGGIAAGAHGEPRNTRDIDFLVGDEAFLKAGPIISFSKPLPLQAYDVAIDPIPLPENRVRWAVLDEALSHPQIDTTTGSAVPLVPPNALAYMKLASPRAKDLADVVAMIRAGSVDVGALEALVTKDEALRERFAAAVAEATLD